MLGAEDPPSPPSPARRPSTPTNGERDEHLSQAVEAARRQAEERATAEILALEEDLEKERERAAKSLEEVQRRLEEAEARAAGRSPSPTSGPARRRPTGCASSAATSAASWRPSSSAA